MKPPKNTDTAPEIELEDRLAALAPPVDEAMPSAAMERLKQSPSPEERAARRQRKTEADFRASARDAMFKEIESSMGYLRYIGADQDSLTQEERGERIKNLIDAMVDLRVAYEQPNSPITAKISLNACSRIRRSILETTVQRLSQQAASAEVLSRFERMDDAAVLQMWMLTAPESKLHAGKSAMPTAESIRADIAAFVAQTLKMQQRLGDVDPTTGKGTWSLGQLSEWARKLEENNLKLSRMPPFDEKFTLEADRLHHVASMLDWLGREYGRDELAAQYATTDFQHVLNSTVQELYAIERINNLRSDAEMMDALRHDLTSSRGERLMAPMKKLFGDHPILTTAGIAVTTAGIAGSALVLGLLAANGGQMLASLIPQTQEESLSIYNKLSRAASAYDNYQANRSIAKHVWGDANAASAVRLFELSHDTANLLLNFVANDFFETALMVTMLNELSVVAVSASKGAAKTITAGMLQEKIEAIAKQQPERSETILKSDAYRHIKSMNPTDLIWLDLVAEAFSKLSAQRDVTAHLREILAETKTIQAAKDVEESTSGVQRDVNILRGMAGIIAKTGIDMAHEHLNKAIVGWEMSLGQLGLHIIPTAAQEDKAVAPNPSDQIIASNTATEETAVTDRGLTGSKKIIQLEAGRGDIAQTPAA